MAVLAALPFVLQRGQPVQRRGLIALALVGLACATWIAGGFAANVRIMCRLF